MWAPRAAPSLDTRGGAPSPGRPSLGAAPPLPLFIEKFLFNSDLSFVLHLALATLEHAQIGSIKDVALEFFATYTPDPSHWTLN